ncbi:hypothetical protein HYH03_010014 [Edaphochlamys debaryana]|uniref:N-acetyltransferase domain-containing protein n=1 Tax=Edaphochlamys debaryana TaxID=47281 RepID=A0A835Y5Y4_9CHLO|nr:hypothetical protein HYH03_010014 [Edaphochlamys debaryana]|eukprot:KAG2491644.1 hypothetical protein HYH03_010014 [Edaphochlamys debaryana]
MGLLIEQRAGLMDMVSFFLALFGALANGFFMTQAFATRSSDHGHWDRALLQLLLVWTEFLLLLALTALLLAASTTALIASRRAPPPDAKTLFLALQAFAWSLGAISRLSALKFIGLLSPQTFLDLQRTGAALARRMKDRAERKAEAAQGPQELREAGRAASVLLAGALLGAWLGASLLCGGMAAVALYVKVSLLGDVFATAPADWTAGQWQRFAQFLLNIAGLTGGGPGRDAARFLFSGADNALSGEESGAMGECLRLVCLGVLWRRGWWAAVMKLNTAFDQGRVSTAFILEEEEDGEAEGVGGEGEGDGKGTRIKLKAPACQRSCAQKPSMCGAVVRGPAARPILATRTHGSAPARAGHVLRAQQLNSASPAPPKLTEDSKAARMMDFTYEFLLPEGRVVVQALPAPLIPPTADLLAQAFIGTAARLAPYARFLRRNIGSYLLEHQALPPKALVLVALLHPHPGPQGELRGEARALQEEQQRALAAKQGKRFFFPPPPSAPSPWPGASVHLPSMGPGAAAPGAEAGAESVSYSSGNGTGTGDNSGEAAAPSGQQEGEQQQPPVIIGTAEVSFSPVTRSSQPFLDPPDRCCYLCNMAVAPAFRRRGVATQLLAAAEAVASHVQGEREVYLHLRFVDAEAAQLYERNGFVKAAEHWPVAPFFGIQRMKLMRKAIAK